MSDDQDLPVVPSAQEYKAAFLQLQCIPRTYLAMLQAHWQAPNLDITAIELAVSVGYPNFNTVNLHYGTLGAYLCDILKLTPSMPLSAIVTFIYYGHEWHWIMRPEVAAALEQLQWQPCKKKTHVKAASKI